MDLQQMGWGGIDWIDLAQDRVRWQVLVIVVMNLRVPLNAGNLLTSRGAIGFWKRSETVGSLVNQSFSQSVGQSVSQLFTSLVIRGMHFSQTQQFITQIILMATCFDSTESSSGLPKNRSNLSIFVVHSGIPDCCDWNLYLVWIR